jgi:iron-sulfur cluster repair protein YtfE (RIC family)
MDSPHSDAIGRLQAEHADLKRLVEEIDQALAARTATVEEVGHLLGQLGDRLVKHFSHEEEGGYFADALSHAPQLIAKANQLLAQHPKMCAQVRTFVTEIGPPASPTEVWWRETARRFAAFRDELLGHERRENALLQEAYTRDLGSHD